MREVGKMCTKEERYPKCYGSFFTLNKKVQQHSEILCRDYLFFSMFSLT